MKYTLYLVGGIIRDELLGLKSKDIDYSVVIDEPEKYSSPEEAYQDFVKTIEDEGFQIFLKSPDCLTVRAKFPKNHPHSGIDADFVIARKETSYKKGTREPNVELGTLYDDLIRRDATVNALAKTIDGSIIDFFGGQKDLIDGILRTPTDTNISFNNDPLRLLRFMRFSITKGLSFSDAVINAMVLFDADKLSVVSDDRIREELGKMFKFDTYKTLALLHWLFEVNNKLHYRLFSGDIWLKPTNEK